jgi:hypothetical protein
VQKASEQEASEAQSQVEVTETATKAAEAQSAADPLAVEGPKVKAAPKKKAPAPKPVAHVQMSSGHEKKSKLAEINEKLKAGYSVADVQKFQANHGGAKKKAAPKPKAKAPIKKKPVKKPDSAAIPDRNDVSEELEAEKAQREAASPPAEETAQVDQQADDIIS